MLSTTIIFLGTLLVVGMTNGAIMDPVYLTTEQRESVANLKSLLNPELTDGYIMEDFELAQWLKENNFNVEVAAKDVNQYLRERKDMKVNQILDEDWSDLRVLFPYTRDTLDKSGKPVVYLNFGEWDIASYLTSQEASDRLVRYVLMMNEETDAHVRRLYAEGRNVTQSSQLVNVGGFSIAKHVCWQCAYLYRDVSTKLPHLRRTKVEKVNLINVPYTFKMVYSFFSDEAKNFVRLYGQDQVELEKLLDSYIDRSQFPKGILNQLALQDNSYGSIVWNKEL